MNEIVMSVSPDEKTFIEILRKCNIDAEVTIYRRDGHIVQVKSTATHVKEFKKMQENGKA